MPWAYGLKSSMQFIDTHTHPYDEAFDEDRPQVMQRAVDSGVARWIFPGIDSTSFAAQLDLYERWKSNAYMGKDIAAKRNVCVKGAGSADTEDIQGLVHRLHLTGFEIHVCQGVKLRHHNVNIVRADTVGQRRNALSVTFSGN